MGKTKINKVENVAGQLVVEDAPRKKAPKKAAEKKQEPVHLPDVSDLRLIETQLILPDPHQPRKESSWKENMELSESVREQGILQPIMVRPNGFGQYIVIYGHRRLWAAEQVGLSHIWCQVRERLEENEIKEIQLIENIQRADMHPIDEAAAFLQLVENSNEPEEIGAKVGKSVFYIRQRLKLNNLAQAWIDVYKSGKVRHKDALQLAILSQEAQTELFESYKGEGEFVLQPWLLSRYRCKLSDANFSQTEDYEGLPKCSQCQFNTGVNSLFPDQEPEAYCKNRKCFELKEAYAFDMNLEKIKEDPAAILLNARYETDKEELQSWKNAGLEVYDHHDFNEMEEPDIQNYEIEDEDDEEEVAENKIQYEKDLQEYRDFIVQPGTIRAFKMNGSNKGEIVFGTLSKKSAPIGLPKNEVAAADNTKAEINRIKDKEKRAKELDGEKVWTKIRELLDNPDMLKKLLSDEPLNGSEIPFLKRAIHLKIGYQHQGWTKKIASSRNNNDIRPMYRALILDALISSYGSHLQKDTDNADAYRYIKEILPKEVAVIELEQQEVAEKRQERVNKKISDLKKKEA